MKTESHDRAQSIVGLTLLALALVLSESADSRDLKEPPFVAGDVRAGKLPPVSDRVPQEPLLVDLEALGKAGGRYGGTLRTLIGKVRDSRLLTVYGYARLVGYDESLQLQPDILESYSVEEGRVFTFRLRNENSVNLDVGFTKFVRRIFKSPIDYRNFGS